MIRLLIADDSALMRKLLGGIFAAEGDFEVRFARDGREALELSRSFDPQVVTLDIQMPDVDGLTCLSRIMVEKPRPVVMISSLTESGAEATLAAMQLGAVDFIAKPAGAVSLEIDQLRPLIVAKVRGAATARIPQTHRLRERVRQRLDKLDSTPFAARARRAGKANQPGLIIIGTSTGGPQALDTVLPGLPPDLAWPVVVAQHMPATFTGQFAKRLALQCDLDVVEVDRPLPLQPGTVYIGRGDADMIVSARAAGPVAMSVPASRTYAWHPSVDRLVESAMEHYPATQIVGVLMTGMGNDGASAMTRLHQAGGRTIAEAQSTAVVWGMPGELVRGGGAETVAPLDSIAAAIAGSVRHAAG